jgi:hypothetical protein
MNSTLIFGILGILGQLGIIGIRHPVTIKDPKISNPQFVILSFDGSRSATMWQQSLDFAKNAGFSIKFTYFVSGVYLIPYKDRFTYQAPGQVPGGSKIGFADNDADVTERMGFINRAVTEGHEIGSHLNGHFSGINWNQNDWESEFSQFEKFTKNKIDFNIIGFRAPNLGVNKYLWPVLKKHGFEYEAGQMGRPDEWPRIEDGIIKFILPGINLTGTKLYPLAMDYNFYVTQTGAKDTLNQQSAKWQIAKKQVVDSLMAYFNKNYAGNRAPVVFASHFSEWNDGLYWEAMKEFAGKVCIISDVKCTTYGEAVLYIKK